MAEKWFMDTTIWQDEYAKNLSDAEFRLFAYLRTNQAVRTGGAMDCDIARIADESGLSDGLFVCDLLDKFGKDGKILIRDQKIYVQGPAEAICPGEFDVPP